MALKALKKQHKKLVKKEEKINEKIRLKELKKSQDESGLVDQEESGLVNQDETDTGQEKSGLSLAPIVVDLVEEPGLGRGDG